MIDTADAVVYVPTIGSLNLAAVVNVVLYDRMAKSAMTVANNELIRRSRDKNNNLKIKTPDAHETAAGGKNRTEMPRRNPL